MRFWLFALVLLHSLVLTAQSDQTVTLKGKAEEYAGYHPVLRMVINPISMETADVLTIPVNEKGEFNQTVEIKEITYARLDVGKYRASIYLEPGETYELVLPPFKPRSDADRFNPYFVPEDVVLGIANDEAQGLNQTIAYFDRDLRERYNSNAVTLFTKENKTLAEKLILELDSLYPSKPGSYFQKYKQYAYAELLAPAYRRQKRKVIYRTMSGDAVMQMPSFTHVINTIFKNFFSNYFGTPQGENLRAAYADKVSFDSLAHVFASDTLFAASEPAELVLLKGLYDAFYSGRYEQEQIIQLFKQAETKGCSPRIRDIAGGLHKKVTQLRPGSIAPQFTLYRLGGKKRSLSDYKGKFVYLNFMHTSNHTCKKDLQLLQVLSVQLKREVKIITIILDEDPSEAKKLIKAKKYKWDFLHFNAQAKIIPDYNIRALPAYFLIDPEQRLRLSPSPSPAENFVHAFFEARQKYKYKQLRIHKPKKKSIYDL